MRSIRTDKSLAHDCREWQSMPRGIYRGGASRERAIDFVGGNKIGLDDAAAYASVQRAAWPMKYRDVDQWREPRMAASCEWAGWPAEVMAAIIWKAWPHGDMKMSAIGAPARRSASIIASSAAACR